MNVNDLTPKQILEQILRAADSGEPVEPSIAQYMSDKLNAAAGNPTPPLNGRALLEAVLRNSGGYGTINGEVIQGRNE